MYYIEVCEFHKEKHMKRSEILTTESARLIDFLDFFAVWLIYDLNRARGSRIAGSWISNNGSSNSINKWQKNGGIF